MSEAQNIVETVAGYGIPVIVANKEVVDVSLSFSKSQDFYEFFRAQLIRKDRNQKWSHDDMSGITAVQIDRLFRKSANPLRSF